MTNIELTQCGRCNEVMSNQDWQVHECKDMRNLNDMNMDLLLRVIKKELTEEEAWKLNDKEFNNEKNTN